MQIKNSEQFYDFYTQLEGDRFAYPKTEIGKQLVSIFGVPDDWCDEDIEWVIEDLENSSLTEITLTKLVEEKQAKVAKENNDYVLEKEQIEALIYRLIDKFISTSVERYNKVFWYKGFKWTYLRTDKAKSYYYSGNGVKRSSTENLDIWVNEKGEERVFFVNPNEVPNYDEWLEDKVKAFKEASLNCSSIIQVQGLAEEYL